LQPVSSQLNAKNADLNMFVDTERTPPHLNHIVNREGETESAISVAARREGNMIQSLQD
jgi:hypothetical protein